MVYLTIYCNDNSIYYVDDPHCSYMNHLPLLVGLTKFTRFLHEKMILSAGLIFSCKNRVNSEVEKIGKITGQNYPNLTRFLRPYTGSNDEREQRKITRCLHVE